MRIYWAYFFKKWENQSKRQLCKEKSWKQGLAPKYSDYVGLSTVLKAVSLQ